MKDIYPFGTIGRINHERIEQGGIHTKFGCYANTGHCFGYNTVSQYKFTIKHDAVNARHRPEIGANPFDGSRHLFIPETQECIFFNHFGEAGD